MTVQLGLDEEEREKKGRRGDSHQLLINHIQQKTIICEIAPKDKSLIIKRRQHLIMHLISTTPVTEASNEVRLTDL